MHFSRTFFVVSLLFAGLLISTGASAQSGGKYAYRFIDIPGSARMAAMGGEVISIRDNDVNMVGRNPSVLDASMHDQFSLSYINYFTGINMGNVQYARKSEKLGTWSAGLQYMNYGKFTRANAAGEQQGDFSAGEYNLNGSYAYQLDSNFTLGGTVKAIYSKLDAWWSMGMAADVGASYYNREKEFSAGLVIRNMGAQFRTYTDGNRDPLPFQIQLGASKRIANAPLRVSAILKHLETFDLTFPTEDNPEEGSNRFSFDNFMRHVGLSVEFMPSDNFWIAAGYNHLRKQELSVANRNGLTGISMGFGFKVRKFNLSYGRATYHVAGSTNQLTITTRLGDLKSRKG